MTDQRPSVSVPHIVAYSLDNAIYPPWLHDEAAVSDQPHLRELAARMEPYFGVTP